MSTMNAIAKLGPTGRTITRVLVMRNADTGELVRFRATGNSAHARAAQARAVLGDAWYRDSATRTAAQREAIPMWGESA